MHGFVIQQSPCAHCLNLRTVRTGTITYCFNCGGKDFVTIYPFTAAELQRLCIYRVAVRAGFFTDEI